MTTNNNDRAEFEAVIREVFGHLSLLVRDDGKYANLYTQSMFDLWCLARSRSGAVPADHGVIYATVRGDDEDDYLGIECRFANGEKYAAVKVASEKDRLAHWIAKALSAEYEARKVDAAPSSAEQPAPKAQEIDLDGCEPHQYPWGGTEEMQRNRRAAAAEGAKAAPATGAPEADERGAEFSELQRSGGVSWCDDKIDAADVEYIRADAARAQSSAAPVGTQAGGWLVVTSPGGRPIAISECDLHVWRNAERLCASTQGALIAAGCSVARYPTPPADAREGELRDFIANRFTGAEIDCDDEDSDSYQVNFRLPDKHWSGFANAWVSSRKGFADAIRLALEDRMGEDGETVRPADRAMGGE